MVIGAAEQRYAALLACHGEAATRQLAEISSTFRFGRFWPLTRAAQPFLLRRADHTRATDGASLFLRGLLAMLTSPSAATARSLAARPRRLALLGDAIACGALLGARVDMLATASGFKVLEINPTTPDFLPFGVECSDPLAELFGENAAVRAFMNEVPGAFVSLRPLLLDSFVSKHARRGGTGAPNLAVVYVPRSAAAGNALAEDVPAPDPHFLSLFGYLMGRGLGVQLCRHDELRYDGKTLTANATSIDVVFTAGDPDYLDTCPDDDPLWRAVRDGAVGTACGHPLGVLLDDKGLVADLSEALEGRTLDAALIDGLSDVVPWTRRLLAGPTTFHGERVDLLAFVRDNRERLVLKPCIGMGGTGILLGWETSAEAWSHALANLAVAYVVQERVIGAKVRLLYLDGDDVANATPTTKELSFDISPYVWSDGHAEGCLVRLSLTDTLNITQGATMAPVYVVDDGTSAR